MAGFSGAIKLAEMNDYLTLNQACIKPLMKKSTAQTATATATGTEEPPIKANSGTRMTVEFELSASDASDLRFPGLAATGGSVASITPTTTATSGGHFNQMKLDPIKKTASVSLNDCLACSGCVTSAETVLITQQSTQELLNVLRGKKKQEEEKKESVISSEVPMSDDSTSSTAVTPEKPPRRVIISLSPQSLTALAHEFKLSPLVCAKKLTTFFVQKLGCMTLVDTTPALDIALLEAREEFVQRFRWNQAQVNGVAQSTPPTDVIPVSTSSSTHTNTVAPTPASPLPILTSECPGWVCYAEKTQGIETLSHMSSVRSAQAIMGVLLKHYWAPANNLSPDQIFHTTIMPCYDKKLEGSRDDFFIEQFATRETDCVLTTGEVVELIKEEGIDLVSLDESPLNTDFFHCSPDQTELYRSLDVGGSGGYTESIFRYAAQQLFNITLPADQPLSYQPGRNPDFRELNLEVNGKTVLNFGLAYGFRNIQNLVRKMKTKKAGKITFEGSLTLSTDSSLDTSLPSTSSTLLPIGTGGYHYVEVMACPSGCLNGGGQIKAIDIKSQKQLVQDLDVSYHTNRSVRAPEENKIIQRIYGSWLKGARPGTGLARTFFHTQYHAVEKELANPLGIKW